MKGKLFVRDLQCTYSCSLGPLYLTYGLGCKLEGPDLASTNWVMLGDRLALRRSWDEMNIIYLAALLGKSTRTNRDAVESGLSRFYYLAKLWGE